MIHLLRTHLRKSWRAVAENLFDRQDMVPPPPALPPPSNTPRGPANAAALWRMRHAAATPPAKAPPTYPGPQIHAARRGDDTRIGSTRDDDARIRSTRDDEARIRSTRDIETRIRPTRDDENRIGSTRDDETRTRLTRDDETWHGSYRGDYGARRSDHRDKRERGSLTGQCRVGDEDLPRESEMKRRGPEESNGGRLWRADFNVFESDDEVRLPVEGEDMAKRQQDRGRGKPDARKRGSERDLDDFAGSKEMMTYASPSRDEVSNAAPNRNEMGYAAPNRSEMVYAEPNRSEMARVGSSRNDRAHPAPSRREIEYGDAIRHESAYTAPSHDEIAYTEASRNELARAAPSRAEMAYSAHSRNEMANAEPSRFDNSQDRTLRDDKYAAHNEDDRWRKEMRDSETPRLEDVHEEAGDWRCRDKDQGTSASGEKSREGSRESVATLPHDSPENECKDVNEVGRRMDNALELSMRSRREAADIALTSAGDATDVVGAAAIPTHNPYKPTCFDVRTIPFALRKLHKFIFSPAPTGGGVVIRCFIERIRSGSNALFPVYKLYTDHEDGTGASLVRCMMLPLIPLFRSIRHGCAEGTSH